MTIQRAILTALDRVSPYLLPEGTLHVDVNMQLPRPITLTDLRGTLQALETKRMVVSVADELDGATKWKVTDNGRAAIAASL